jgi:hypothetical protein
MPAARKNTSAMRNCAGCAAVKVEFESLFIVIQMFGNAPSLGTRPDRFGKAPILTSKFREGPDFSRANTAHYDSGFSR